ncbi:glutaminase [Hyphobacterium marinum]|uniref:Glutaminase n=1 Tax=Hyphobacterium marinum TaxID=3116574 RepID=A0ABU7LUP6_9PROT|nr:glutaminase [Hyphobacterium sp. Y6023]MEE2565268.1 glutaminase [Hyphobacterium sp. Y6023]
MPEQTPADFDVLLDRIAATARAEIGKGQVADYIPALARIPAGKFGIAVCAVDGAEWTTGDAREAFSIQSISKVLTLLLAMETIGPDAVWSRVGREPSGTPFNSLVQLEGERGIPRNPFINAGALVVTDCLTAQTVSPAYQLLTMARRWSGNPDLAFDESVARSEAEHGHRNAAIAHFLKSQGNLKSKVEDVLHVYYRQCALAMSCLDLARAFLPLANKGQTLDGRSLIPPLRVKRVNSLLLTCGLYDGVGNFAFRVGIPAKSGVGGGIVAVIPGRYSICVWSPELDELGNSLPGTAALEAFTDATQSSIF